MNSQDPDFPSKPSHHHDRVTYSKKRGLPFQPVRFSITIRDQKSLIVGLFFSLTFIVTVYPLAVHAGVFSLLFDFFNAERLIYTNAEAKTQGPQGIGALQAALNIDPNPSKGGGDITIIDDQALLAELGPLGTRKDLEEFKPSDQVNIYVVHEGDSLSEIAQMFGVSVSTIVWANDIKRESMVQVGETLVILPISGVRHTVKKGDTLQSIAKQYKGDAGEISRYNDITENVALALGDTILIPDGEVPAPQPTRGSSARIITGSDGPAHDGYYTHPLPGGKKTQGLHGYNGIDIGAPNGTPIIAAASGYVVVSKNSGWNGGYGNYIVIKHENGTQTLYAHMSGNIVSSGQSIVQSQVIGYVGSTGKSTGSHLHFEVRGAKNPF